MSMSSETPLQSLAQNIHLYEPPSVENPAASTDPSLVILCTWLGGATPRRIHKYIDGYQREFPSSSILLITSIVLDITLRTVHAIRARLPPARDAIARVLTTQNDQSTVTSGSNNNNNNNILLHAFSHGGSNTAVQLALSWQEEHNSPLPLRGLILDCSPGDTTFRRSYAAAVLSLPSETTPPVHSIGRALLYPTIATVTVLQRLHLMASVRDLRRQLNDPDVFGARVRRMYIFSEADEMVGAHNVRSHAVEARRAGFAVEEVVFQTAEHCALVLEDAGRYWGAVRAFWGDDNALELRMRVVEGRGGSKL